MCSYSNWQRDQPEMLDVAGSTPAERTTARDGPDARGRISALSRAAPRAVAASLAQLDCAARLYREGCRFESGRRLAMTAGGTGRPARLLDRDTLQVRGLGGQHAQHAAVARLAGARSWYERGSRFEPGSRQK